MSLLTEELDRKTIIAWRSFAASPAFQLGLDWLRHNKAPATTGSNEIELLKSALSWGAYMKAIDDVQDVLTVLPTPAESTDEPSISNS